LNLVIYNHQTIQDTTTINELTKGLLALQDKSSILLAYNCKCIVNA
jgi:hypothetical protein